ncbi:alpha/beta hydrolase [Lyngbya confervoides]|uniref:Alpha/beta hydrolase n=1 Tax=Lyngbya confervoides BDU141951 TaxID=1574623 RepID=A0ABD4T1N3_9CYAN|nr:alpha/beta hydrolase [Lyngbya confervoides]MCM1982554.1 alpha/beta hydrolase [Lyngbya confervoides BDU141951]
MTDHPSLSPVNGIVLETAGLTEPTSLNVLRQLQTVPIPTQAPPGLDLPAQVINTTCLQQTAKKTAPIVLLHGFDSSVLEFRRLLPQLQDHSCYALDMLGFGFTDRPRGWPISPGTIQAHLDGFWQSQIQAPMILVGASMGGAAAMDFALSYPDRVQQLVLLDPAGWQSGGSQGRLLIPPLGYLATSFLANPRVRQKISERAYCDRTLASQDAQTCAALHLKAPGWREGLISFTRNQGYGSFREKIPQITQPTLLLWGRQDRILGTKDTETMAAAIPDCDLVWIENCGHVPHLEKPQVVAQLILEKIAGGRLESSILH